MDKLRAIIDRVGSIAKLERDARIASGTISNWMTRGRETGVVGVNPDYLERVIAAVGITPDEIRVNGDDDAKATLDEVGAKVEKMIADGRIIPKDAIEWAKRIEKAAARRRAK